jgi:hypothetical protein
VKEDFQEMPARAAASQSSKELMNEDEVIGQFSQLLEYPRFHHIAVNIL